MRVNNDDDMAMTISVYKIPELCHSIFRTDGHVGNAKKLKYIKENNKKDRVHKYVIFSLTLERYQFFLPAFSNHFLALCSRLDLIKLDY